MGIAKNPDGVSGVGYGQSWTDATTFRSSGVLYYNTTGKPIIVSVQTTNAAHSGDLSVDGYTVTNPYQPTGLQQTCTAIVPVGKSYRYTANAGGIAKWSELR